MTQMLEKIFNKHLGHLFDSNSKHRKMAKETTLFHANFEKKKCLIE